MTWAGFETRTGIAGWRRGDGDTLAVVLHGGPGLGDYTEPLGDEVLAAAPDRLRVARYQQRGQAPSSTAGDLTVEQAVADCVEVIRTCEADRALIVGHSWGGHLAMHVAHVAPAHVLGLLVVDPLGAVGDGGAEDLDRIIFERIGPGAVAAIAEVEAGDGSEDEKSRAELALIWPGYFVEPAVAPPPPDIAWDKRVMGAYMADALPMLASGALAQRVADTTVPAHFLLGAASPIPPVHGERTAELMRGATTTTVPDAGHFMWLEAPGSATEATRTILTRLGIDC